MATNKFFLADSFQLYVTHDATWASLSLAAACASKQGEIEQAASSALAHDDIDAIPRLCCCSHMPLWQNESPSLALTLGPLIRAGCIIR